MPELFELSHILLAVPTTQLRTFLILIVSVERSFSGLKFILSDQRILIEVYNKNIKLQFLISVKVSNNQNQTSLIFFVSVFIEMSSRSLLMIISNG
ncbi:zinc finger BED domain-containing protein RICESLEEPER 1-like isoform X1 [Aphis craccivora]|uniref:Zinc finger BED domain-containing protein RICESLEEPER 1-like isoform X1 n=1 Tax=Aphis craccivora TaxID=307492 RepID=A0A6G0W1B0_APHCR|nr:zinc finger BED domain-containing protein RICESLEEPER 1-like isoform X1 [Aphis craccivora]